MADAAEGPVILTPFSLVGGRGPIDFFVDGDVAQTLNASQESVVELCKELNAGRIDPAMAIAGTRFNSTVGFNCHLSTSNADEYKIL